MYFTPTASSLAKTQQQAPSSSSSSSKPTKPTKSTTSTPTPKPTIHPIAGTYLLTCASLSDDFGPHPIGLSQPFTLTLATDAGKVWGAFNLGLFKGIIQLPRRPFCASPKSSISFSWRGMEHRAPSSGEGEDGEWGRDIEFGEFCVGSLAFLGGGGIKGTINVFGDCEFSGVRMEEGKGKGRSVESMRREWEGYNEDAIIADNVKRWGPDWEMLMFGLFAELG